MYEILWHVATLGGVFSKSTITDQQPLSLHLFRYEKLYRNISDTRSLIRLVSGLIKSDIGESRYAKGYERYSGNGQYRQHLMTELMTNFKLLEDLRLGLISQQQEISALETSILR